MIGASSTFWEYFFFGFIVLGVGALNMILEYWMQIAVLILGWMFIKQILRIVKGRNMKHLLIAGGLALLLSSGCSSKVTRIEFSCITVPSAESVVTNCADPETWREWLKSQNGEI